MWVRVTTHGNLLATFFDKTGGHWSISISAAIDSTTLNSSSDLFPVIGVIIFSNLAWKFATNWKENLA